MKLAILAPEFVPTWGGVGIYTVELVRELAEYPDFEVPVIAPKRGGKSTPWKTFLTLNQTRRFFYISLNHNRKIYK